MTKVLKINGVKATRVRVVSDMNPSICFDITVPEDCVGKLKALAPICGSAWYDNPDYEAAGFAEPLCDALETHGITYILHSDVVEEPDDWADFC